MKNYVNYISENVSLNDKVIIEILNEIDNPTTIKNIVNSIDKKNITTFMNIVKSNNIDIIKKVIPYVDDINAIDKNGKTAAYYNRNVEVLKLLIKNGIDLKKLPRKDCFISYYLNNNTSKEQVEFMKELIINDKVNVYDTCYAYSQNIQLGILKILSRNIFYDELKNIIDIDKCSITTIDNLFIYHSNKRLKDFLSNITPEIIDQLTIKNKVDILKFYPEKHTENILNSFTCKFDIIALMELYEKLNNGQAVATLYNNLIKRDIDLNYEHKEYIDYIKIKYKNQIHGKKFNL